MTDLNLFRPFLVDTTERTERGQSPFTVWGTSAKEVWYLWIKRYGRDTLISVREAAFVPEDGTWAIVPDGESMSRLDNGQIIVANSYSIRKGKEDK